MLRFTPKPVLTAIFLALGCASVPGLGRDPAVVEVVSRFRRLWPGCAQMVVDATPTPVETFEDPDAPDFENSLNALRELEIEKHEWWVGQSLSRLLADGSSPNYKQIREFEAGLYARIPEGSDRLATLAPRVVLFCTETREEWDYLKSFHAVRTVALKLKHFGTWGHQAEFAPMYFNPLNNALGLNFLFDLDTWIEGADAQDFAEPNSRLVQEIAWAYYLKRTGRVMASLDGRITAKQTFTMEVEPDQEFLDWFSGVYQRHSGFFSQRISQRTAVLRSDPRALPDPQQVASRETITQAWRFFGKRRALLRSYRFFQDHHRVLPGKSFLFERLNEGAVARAPERTRFLDWLEKNEGVNRDLMVELWDEETPSALLKIPESIVR